MKRVSSKETTHRGSPRNSSDDDAFTHRRSKRLSLQDVTRPSSRPRYKEPLPSDDEEQEKSSDDQGEDEKDAEEVDEKLPPCKKAKVTSLTSPLTDIECFLDMRSTESSKEIFVKWKGKSYMHCSWLEESEILKSATEMDKASGNLLRRKLDKFFKGLKSPANGEEENEGDQEEEKVNGIDPQWLLVDRIIAESQTKKSISSDFLVKWKGLGYDHCTWERESDLSQFQDEITRFKARTAIRVTRLDALLQLGARNPVQAKEEPGNASSSCQLIGSSADRGKGSRAFSSTPTWLNGTLHPYQIEGLNWIYHKWTIGTNVILGDEMGLGKTAQAIAFMSSSLHSSAKASERKPFLVVAPLSTLNNWERELQMWAPDLNVVTLIGNAEGREVILKHELFVPASRTRGQSPSDLQDRVKFHILLTSYEIVSRERSSLAKIDYEGVVVDEAHRLKSKGSLLFQDLSVIRSNHKLLLTGTPLQNNLKELFTLLHFLEPQSFNIDSLEQQFASIRQQEHVDEIHKLLSPHLLRRLKKDVLKGLPPKQEQIVRVELSPMQQEWYKTLLARHYPTLAASEAGSSARQMPAREILGGLQNLVMQLRKVCNHPYLFDGAEPLPSNPASSNQEVPSKALEAMIASSGKLQLVDRMVIKLVEQGHRVLIFSQFTRMLDILEDWLAFRHIGYQRIDGSVAGAVRQKRIDRFNQHQHLQQQQPSSNCETAGSSSSVFLLSTRAGGQGINLASADTVIIFDSDWNPHNDLQAMSRAHRLGQKSPVMVYRLVTRATVEERMMHQMKEKLVLEHLVVRKMPGNAALNDNEGEEEEEEEEGKEKDAGRSGCRKKARKGKMDQKELDEILKYGARELFSSEATLQTKSVENGSEPLTIDQDRALGSEQKKDQDSKRIVWNDSLIDKLLDRSELELMKAAGGGGEEEEEESDLLKAFKVADFEMIAADTEKEASEKKADGDKGEAASSFWDSLLRQHYEVINVEEEAIAENGGRRAKRSRAVNYSEEAMFSALQGLEGFEEEDEKEKKEEEEEEEDQLSSGSMDETESGGIDDVKEKNLKQTSELGTATNPKTSKAVEKNTIPTVRPNINNDIRSIPLMAGEGNELTIFGFDKSERRTMLGFIMKRGFSPNLPFWSTCLAQIFSPIQYGQRPIAYMTLFMQCILEQKRDSSTFSNGIPKSALLNMMDGVDVPIERVLQTVGLHSRVAAVVYNGQEVCSDEEAALAIASRVRIALSYGALEFTSTRLWAPNHDAILLKAVVRHGYGLWKKILDEAKGLRERVVEECGDKENPEDWIKIRIEGLDRAFRIAEDHEKAQRREVYVEGLKRKLITQYNKITSCISKKPRENPLQLEEIMAGYKSMFEEISGIQ